MARRAIIDIGSNSIRLVVFGGTPRAPVELFNEKLMAGLGRGVVATGRLDPEAAQRALDGMARFAALLSLMEPMPLRVVATAAVREAADGAEFLERVRALGLPAELLDGRGEALAAGHGVLSGLPWANGLVADMGGGSLELVRVAEGEASEPLSLPLGVMRVAEIRAAGSGRLRKALRGMLAGQDWIGQGAGRPLYLVGGSWRTLARVHMAERQWPLPIVGNYAFPAEGARWLKARVRELGPERLAAISGIKANRVAQLDDAAALLAALVALIGPSAVVISAQGLREGLLFEALDPQTRALDPLIEGIRHAIGRQEHDPADAAALLAWSDPLFAGEAAGERRLRHAAFLLAAMAWAANPDFRVSEESDLALHGNWQGVDAPGRAMMAMALHVGFGGDPLQPPAILPQLVGEAALARAAAWGHVLRLSRRLSGNSPGAVRRLPLTLGKRGEVVLSLPADLAALADAGVGRRLAALARSLGRASRIGVLHS